MSNKYIPLNLKVKETKLETIQRLQPEDHYTFIGKEFLKHEHPTDESKVINLVEGDIFYRNFGDGVQRIFQILWIYKKENEWAYETRYMGIHNPPE